VHLFPADPGALGALFQVSMIDLVLAGDNAVVIGMAAAGLSSGMRRKAILIGIGAATLLRIALALVATQMLAFTGLLLAGGLLLLWVCYKMWQELRGHGHAAQTPGIAANLPNAPSGKTLKQAVLQIVIADVSMSVDNVLAVAGAARRHIEALVFGLGLSVVLMGLASSVIARLLGKQHWIAWAGLAVIVYVAVRMVYDGLDQVVGDALPDLPRLQLPSVA
jgi:YjbE family integral membrane protein